MIAVVLDAPGPVEALKLRQLPVPVPELGWVLIEVKAAGVNRSELHTRLGLAQGVTFPRVPGIEAAGVVAACPGGELEVGAQVSAMMGAMWAQLRRAAMCVAPLTAATVTTPACRSDRWFLSPAVCRGRSWARSPRCCRRRTDP